MGFNRYYNEKSKGCVLTQTPCWKLGSVCSDCDVPYQVHGHRDESIPLKYKYDRVDTMNHVCDYRKETWVHPQSNIKTCKYTCVICGNTYSENIPTNYDTWTRTKGNVSRGGYIEAGRAKIIEYNRNRELDHTLCITHSTEPTECDVSTHVPNDIEEDAPLKYNVGYARETLIEIGVLEEVKGKMKKRETFWQQLKRIIFG